MVQIKVSGKPMPMKLLILGLLLERNMHPYEITLVMKERSMDQVIKLQTGSLYYAVDKLAAGGHIRRWRSFTARTGRIRPSTALRIKAKN